MAPTEPRYDQPLSEADIQAYADGILEPERAARLQNYLGNRPDEARRVAFYGRLNVQIRHAFQQTDGPSRARPLNQPGWRTVLHRLFATQGRIVVGLVVLTLVAVSGWMAASLVSAEALNNAAVMALTETAGARLSAGHPGLDAGLGRSAPDLTPAGLRLAGATTLRLGPFARASEFAYRNADGQPVVLLTARALTAAAEPQWAARRAGDFRLLTWTAGHQRYVLAGHADARGLMRAADAMTSS
jgi:anti-sigma factor RsiW